MSTSANLSVREEAPCVCCGTLTTDRDAFIGDAVCAQCWRTGPYHRKLVERGANSCSLAAATAEWESLVAAKWGAVRQSKDFFIAAYRPQLAHFDDLRRRRETSAEVMRWTVEWFAQRGHAVECVPDADGESFGIRDSILAELDAETKPVRDELAASRKLSGEDMQTRVSD